MPALYRIRRPVVRKVALVKNPASGNRWHLFKQAPELGELIKGNGDWKVAYTVVAEPGRVEQGGIGPDGQIVKDANGQPISDVWDAAAIREAAHTFAQHGGLTSDAHFEDGSTLGSWRESYIAPVDHEIEGRPIKAGSWVLGIEPSAEGRAKIEAGEINGVSVEGDSVREPVLAKAGDCGCDDDVVEDVVMGLVKSALVKATLTTARRKQLPSSAFALSGGRYPIHDRSHAVNALARVAQNGTPAEQAQVKRAVCRRYPDLPACKS